MFRPMTSSVSILSDYVANGHQVMHSVSSSLSKIPYGGFSPVRLQTESASRHLRRRARTRRLIGGQWFRRCAPVALAGNSAGHLPEPFGPEALGSPAGYAVPPGHCLLWPHPRLWPPSAGLLFFVRRTLQRPELPNFYLPVLSSVLPALPRQTGRPATVGIPTVIALAVLGTAQHLRAQASRFTPGCVTRLYSSLIAAARKMANPSPTRAFTFELSLHESPPATSSITTRANSQFPAVGLPPTGQAALLAATEGTEDTTRASPATQATKRRRGGIFAGCEEMDGLWHREKPLLPAKSAENAKKDKTKY